MDNLKTRFLDIDTEGKPFAAISREAKEAAELEIHSELANLYYDQWVDGEMWKEFTINENEQIQD